MMSEEIRKAVEELDALILEQKSLMHQAGEEGDWQRYNELSSYQNGLKKARKNTVSGEFRFYASSWIIMKFSDIAECLRKHGYTEKESLPHHRVFYEFGTMDFLISDVAKKYEMDYFDGEVEKVVMTQYWFGTTEFKTILTLDELYNSL